MKIPTWISWIKTPIIWTRNILVVLFLLSMLALLLMLASCVIVGKGCQALVTELEKSSMTSTAVNKKSEIFKFEKQVLELNPKASPEKLQEARDLEIKLNAAESKVSKIDSSLPEQKFEEVVLLNEKMVNVYSICKHFELVVREAFIKLRTCFGASVATKESIEKFRNSSVSSSFLLDQSIKAMIEDRIDAIDERYINPAIRRMNTEVSRPYVQKYIDRCLEEYFQEQEKRIDVFGNRLSEETIRRAKEIRS